MTDCLTLSINDVHMYGDEQTVVDRVTVDNCPIRGWLVRARCDIRAGDLVYRIPTIHVSGKVNVQMDFNGHRIAIAHKHFMTKTAERDIYGDEMYEFTWFDMFLNHSCDPNIYHTIGPDHYQIVRAVRDVKAGEELLCDYNMLEWINDNPFVCHCQSVDCCKVVRGFKYLSDEKKKSALHRQLVTEYVLSYVNCVLNQSHNYFFTGSSAVLT